MKRSSARLVIGLLAFALVLAGAYILYQRLDPAAPQGEQQGAAPAPDFTVEDAEGNAVRLSDMEGEPVVLNFWASWCPPCAGEMPEFQRAFQSKGDGVRFMMVNMTGSRGETKRTAQTFAAEAGYTFPVYFDTRGEAACVYRVTGIPATYFISRRGEVLRSVVGPLTEQALRDGIALIQ